MGLRIVGRKTGEGLLLYADDWFEQYLYEVVIDKALASNIVDMYESRS